MKNITISQAQLLSLVRKAYGVKGGPPSKPTVQDLVRLAARSNQDPDPTHSLSIREAIRATLEEHGELKSRDISYYIKRHIPLATRSRNLPALIQSTLGDMQDNREIVRKGPKGRSVYRLKAA